jgi:cbb3-type cytochrome oxidase subunit 3
LSRRTIREAKAAAVIVLGLFLILALMSMFTKKGEEDRQSEQ